MKNIKRIQDIKKLDKKEQQKAIIFAQEIQDIRETTNVLKAKNHLESTRMLRLHILDFEFKESKLVAAFELKYNKKIVSALLPAKKAAPVKKAPAKKVTPKKAVKKVTAKKVTPAKKAVLSFPDTMSAKTMKRLKIDPKKRILDLLELEKIGARFEKTEKKAPAKIEKNEKMEKMEKIFSLEKKAKKTKNINAKNVFVFEINKIKNSIFSNLKKIEVKRIDKGISSIFSIA